MTDGVWTVNIDGAARGNPGPAACAFVLRPPNGPTVEHAERIGTATNNVAEYTALVMALEKAAELGAARLAVASDSELLVKQMNGEYQVKNEDLRTLYEEATELRRRFRSVTLTHVRREQNKRADELCNLALDGKPLTGTAATVSKPAVQKPAPSATVSDASVREDAIACLEAAARAWAAGNPQHPSAAAVWEQLWSVLEDGGVLKKKRS